MLPTSLLLLVVAAVTTPLPVDPESDPLARDDPFLKLTSEELRTRWSSDADPLEEASAAAARTLHQRLQRLDALRETIFIDVRLVGFDGDGEHEVSLQEDALQRLLDAAAHEEPLHVVHPRPSAPSELAVRRRFLFHVKRAQKSLGSRVARAIASAVGDHGADVPLSAVDGIIRSDYLGQRSSHVVMYLLNPPSPRRAPNAGEREQGGMAGDAAADANATDGRQWWQRLPYRYVDDDGEGTVAAGGGGGPSCPLTHWVGVADEGKVERYLWIDLSAGPVAYGPSASGDGVVTDHALPSVLSLARRFSAASEVSSHLAVEIAALCVRTAWQLLAPPINWLPTRFYPRLAVVVVRISDSFGDEDPVLASGWDRDLSRLTAQLEQLSLPGQSVSLKTVRTSLSECLACAAALTAATRTHGLDAASMPSSSASPHSHAQAFVERKHLDGETLARLMCV
jgi:hypothetical protein